MAIIAGTEAGCLNEACVELNPFHLLTHLVPWTIAFEIPAWAHVTTSNQWSPSTICNYHLILLTNSFLKKQKCLFATLQ